MSSTVILNFANNKQARAFFKYFKEYGFDDLIMSDSVRDNLPSKYFYEEIVDAIEADEEEDIDYVINID